MKYENPGYNRLLVAEFYRLEWNRPDFVINENVFEKVICGDG